MIEARRGKDTEGIRGSMGMPMRSGVHTWALKWSHEPARGGQGDAVGICTDDTEDFGPSAPPCIGGDGSGLTSLALHATGDIFHNGACLAKVRASTRFHPCRFDRFMTSVCDL